MNGLTCSPRKTEPARLSWGLTLLPLFLLGCGSEVYEARLQETIKYFEYEQKLNQNLSPQPYSGAGISLRVPQQFKNIPAPKPPGKDEEPSEEPPVDQRQPHFLTQELPGLELAFVADVEVEGELPKEDAEPETEQPTSENAPAAEEEKKEESSGPPTAPAYLFVLSNASLYLQTSEEQKIKPMEFNEVVNNLLKESVNYRRFEEIGTSDEQFPYAAQSYVPHKQFSVWGLQRLIPNRHFENLETNMTVYQISEGDIQVTIITIIPTNIAPKEDLEERVRLALETVKVDSKAPTQGTKPGAPVGDF